MGELKVILDKDNKTKEDIEKLRHNLHKLRSPFMERAQACVNEYDKTQDLKHTKDSIELSKRGFWIKVGLLICAVLSLLLAYLKYRS